MKKKMVHIEYDWTERPFFRKAAASRETEDGLIRRLFPILMRRTERYGIMPTDRWRSAPGFRDGWIGHFAFPTCRIMPGSTLFPD